MKKYVSGLLLAGALLPLALSGVPIRAQERLTPPSAQTALKALQAAPNDAQGNALAEQMRAFFGGDDLAKGARAKTDGPIAIFAIEAANVSRPPVLVSDKGTVLYTPLTRLGSSNVYATAVTLSSGAGMDYAYLVNGKRQGGGSLEYFAHQPANDPLPGAPKGKVTKQTPWRSKIFDGTSRDWWVYVPAQYTPDKPACVMVFQDGGSYIGFVPTVFDNLVAKGQMPVTVGIFINPGSFPEQRDGQGNPRSNRSFEYDTLSDQYPRFLLEEILPEVEKTIKLRQDGDSRAIAGASSGGICAFTAAWERPNAFRKVLSWIGSFTDIAHGADNKQGGHNYPFLIRLNDPKPIRVFLQDGVNDLNNPFGSWPLANQQMASALAFKNYDYRFDFGNGHHNYEHGRYILADSLRWLWRDFHPSN